MGTHHSEGDTEMNANARQARHAIRTRTRTQRAASRINRRGTGTLASHAIAAGLTPSQARTVASSLRRAATKLGIHGEAGISYAKGRARTCKRYTRHEVAVIALAYRPRRAEYKACAARLALAA